MKYMRRRGLRMFAVAALLPMIALAQNNVQSNKPAGPQDATTQQVTQLVRDFLFNVPKNDPKVFQEFFADDVIYTRAVGVTVAKADILKNIDARAAVDPQARAKSVSLMNTTPGLHARLLVTAATR